MQLVHFLMLAGVLGAAAHPSGHAHLHRSAHAKRAGDQVHVKNVHSKTIPKPTSSAAPSPTSSAAPAATTLSEGTQSSQSNAFIAFCGGTSTPISKAKRVTYDQIMYTGNTGTNNGCTWNSNLMQVPNNIADQYQYVQKYTNVASTAYQVVCANKMGADGQLTGMFKVAGQQQLIFTLQPGETKTVVADSNTQGVCAFAPNAVPTTTHGQYAGVCAFAPNAVPTTTHGQYAGVWAEFDFGNTSNQGWSGADCSSLVAQAYSMDVPGCRMSHAGVDSTILPGGQGTNAYTKGMEALDGIGLNIVAGKTVIEVKVGFSG